MECELVRSLSDDQIWDLLEGNLDDDMAQFVRSHSLWCGGCLEYYGAQIERLNASDPKRYRICTSEKFSVRKAELLRFCKRHNISIDITELKDPNEFCRYAVGALLKDHAPEFHRLWETASIEERGDMMIGILQYLEDPSSDEVE